jgi:dipeptidyl aminopeptidase/acylaminoacyl peptidase
MERDISGTRLYGEVDAFLRSIWEPGFGGPLDINELSPHPDGTRAAFTAQWWTELVGKPGSRIGVVDLTTGESAIVSGGERDRAPAWSPDGRTLAFLADRAEAGVHQLWLLRDGIGEAIATPAVDGVVEALAWSPDGAAILLVVAGRGAELAGIQGSGAPRAATTELPSWAPAVDVGDAEHHWRRLWRHDLATGETTPLLHDAGNVWEAVWAGPSAVAAIVSDGPSESAWYDSRLEVRNVSGELLATHVPPRQLGMPSASPDGRYVAVIDALASDRAVICGDLAVLDTATGDEWRIVTDRVDVSHTAWRDDTHVVLSGHRGARTVIAELDVTTGEVAERWDSDSTCGGRVFPASWPVGDSDIAFVHEANDTIPTISVLRGDALEAVCSFPHAGHDAIRDVVGSFRAVSWTAPDGRTIEGFLALPKGDGPFPLIVEVHGGPVWAFRNTWLGRNRLIALSLARGFAHFWPNPRGSNGWGQEFVELVYGDMAGDDVLDILTGIDHVVATNPIDVTRIGVTGGSYGGYMTYVLITRDERFAAAVALCPISDYYSTHWSCNIPEFCRRFLADEPENPTGRYWTRSPIHDSATCVTPTLSIVGALDRCAPTTQGEFFHRALVEHGRVPSVLVSYPEEGHGVQTYPAAIDFLARVVTWFEGNLK